MPHRPFRRAAIAFLAAAVLAGVAALPAGAQDDPAGTPATPATPTTSIAPTTTVGTPATPPPSPDPSAEASTGPELPADPPPQADPPVIDVAALTALAAARRSQAEATLTRQRSATAATAATAAAALEEARNAHTAALDDATAAADKLRDAERAEADATADLHTVAVTSFMSAGTGADIGIAELALGSDGTDPSAAIYLTAAADTSRDTLQTARRARADARAAADAADEHVNSTAATLDAAQGRLDAANTASTAAAARTVDDILNGAGTDIGGGAGDLTILGRSAVDAADLAAFVRTRGGGAPGVDLDELAVAFITEGDAEGVRGDVAWVQSILETGWFTYRNSMVDVADHNYAGIGACDSCRTGYRFPTVQEGARAQMQLLRAYATPGLTSADYAHPPVRTTPERLGVRGCCATWMALSGVWATGDGYGIKILTLYNQLLSFAAERHQAGIAAAPPAEPGA